MCNYTIDNNSDLERLKLNVDILMRTILIKNQEQDLPASKQLHLFE